MDAGEQAKQGRPIDQYAAQRRLAAGVLADRQPIQATAGPTRAANSLSRVVLPDPAGPDSRVKLRGR